MAFKVNELFTTDNQEVIKEFTFKNEYLQFSCLNVGASITEFTHLASNNNIVLGYEDKTHYLENPNYFGCVVGRNAGRIQNGLLPIDGRTHQLTQNFLDKHSLHSGIHGFQHKVFKETIEGNKLILKATSKSGEQGFPGDVQLSVTYELIGDELHLSYQATTNEKTLINLTNHSGFNLNNDKGQTILNHQLEVNASKYFVLDEEMIPIHSEWVDGTPLDFRTKKPIGQDIEANHPQIQIGRGFDHPYLIDKKEAMEKAATLSNEQYQLDVFTDREVIVIYSGNFLEGKYAIGNGHVDQHRNMLCLETHGIPNSPHIKGYEACNLINPDELYTHYTVWKLTVK